MGHGRLRSLRELRDYVQEHQQQFAERAAARPLQGGRVTPHANLQNALRQQNHGELRWYLMLSKVAAGRSRPWTSTERLLLKSTWDAIHICLRPDTYSPTPPSELQVFCQSMTMRSLNVQYPWSRLLLHGTKLVEVRRYPLGRRNIIHKHEEVFLIETPAKGKFDRSLLDGQFAWAAVSGHQLPGPPKHAQVIGTIRFSHHTEYKSFADFRTDEPCHLIGRSSLFEWDGKSCLYAWHVQSWRLFTTPTPAGLKTQTGYSKPKTLSVSTTDDVAPAAKSQVAEASLR